MLKSHYLCISFIIVVMISLFYGGYLISSQSGNKKVVISLNPSSSSRGLAGIENPSLVTSNPDPQNLIKQALVEPTPESMKFYLGQFLVPSGQGTYVLACQKYQTLNMIFLAVGTSIHGHLPEMIIRSDCQITENKPFQIGPFFIPTKQILHSPIRESLFSMNNSVVLFHHTVIRRPTTWILARVRFINEKTNEELSINLPNNNNDENSLIINLK